MRPIANFSLVALDCPEPRALAEFYSAITGWSIDHDDGEWVRLASDGGATLACQLAPNHVPPEWPDGSPQQIHIDFDVEDLDYAEKQVMALGAVKAEVQPQPDDWRVFIDPAGHPFCLVLDEDDDDDDEADDDDEIEFDQDDFGVDDEE